MICSLLSQFLTHAHASSEAIDTLYSQSKSGRKIASDILLAVLRQLLSGFGHIYIILDALDECADRGDLMQSLRAISAWGYENIHILMTSRRESDITESLDAWVISQVPMNIEDVNIDIQIYIQEQLHNDTRLRKWSQDVLTHIEEALMAKAQGM